MSNAESCSLNLSEYVVLVLFEALRQPGFHREIG